MVRRRSALLILPTERGRASDAARRDEFHIKPLVAEIRQRSSLKRRSAHRRAPRREFRHAATKTTFGSVLAASVVYPVPGVAFRTAMEWLTRNRDGNAS